MASLFHASAYRARDVARTLIYHSMTYIGFPSACLSNCQTASRVSFLLALFALEPVGRIGLTDVTHDTVLYVNVVDEHQHSGGRAHISRASGLRNLSLTSSAVYCLSRTVRSFSDVLCAHQVEVNSTLLQRCGLVLIGFCLTFCNR